MKNIIRIKIRILILSLLYSISNFKKKVEIHEEIKRKTMLLNIKMISNRNKASLIK